MLSLKMRRLCLAPKRVALLALRGIALCVIGLAFVPSAGAVTAAQIVSAINAERHANGLPPVREDPALSAGCAEYDNYRQLAKITLSSLTIQYPDGTVKAPDYSFLTGGFRDGRRGHKARTSKKPTGKFSSPRPSIVIEVGPPVGEGPYKLKMIYQYQEPGHRLVYSTTVPFSATVYGQ